MAFNRYPPFLFQFHAVEHLIVHIPFRDGIGELEQAVGKGAFAMVDMRNDAKVPDVLHENNSIDANEKVRQIYLKFMS
jgi:hypothetical protein